MPVQRNRTGNTRNDLNVAMGRESFIKVVESYRNFLEERTGYIL